MSQMAGGGRRFHEPGVGSRTGLRMSGAPDDMAGFLAASKAQMQSRGGGRAHEDDSEEVDEEGDHGQEENDSEDGYDYQAPGASARRYEPEYYDDEDETGDYIDRGRAGKGRASGSSARGAAAGRSSTSSRGRGGARKSTTRGRSSASTSSGRGRKTGSSSAMDIASSEYERLRFRRVSIFSDVPRLSSHAPSASGPSPRTMHRRSIAAGSRSSQYESDGERSFDISRMAGDSDDGQVNAYEDDMPPLDERYDDYDEEGRYYDDEGREEEEVRAPATGLAARKAAKKGGRSSGTEELFKPLSRQQYASSSSPRKKQGGVNGVAGGRGYLDLSSGEEAEEERRASSSVRRGGAGSGRKSNRQEQYDDEEQEIYDDAQEELMDDRYAIEYEEEDANLAILDRTTAGKKEKAAALKTRQNAKGKGKTKQPASRPTASKGKASRNNARRRDEDSEDDSEEDEAADHLAPLKVLKRSVTTPAARKARGPSVDRLEVVERVVSTVVPRGAREESAEDGPRRSARHRYAPLDWWRGERAVYGRPSNGKGGASGGSGRSPRRQSMGSSIPVPRLREIVRIPRMPGEGTFSGLKAGQQKKSNYRKRSTSRGMSADPEGDEGGPKKRRKKDDPDESRDMYIELDPTAGSYNVEDGWDKDTEPYGTVFDADTSTEVQRRELPSFLSV